MEEMNMRKKPTRESILPNVRSPTRFRFDENGMYWFDDEGGKHKIVKADILANGVRDLCIYWKGPGMNDVTVGKIVEVPKEHILWIPKGDILWIRFDPPLADGRCSAYLDVRADPVVKDIVREILRRFGGEKGSDYDMFGGEQYL
jgi:hypothetical protein